MSFGVGTRQMYARHQKAHVERTEARSFSKRAVKYSLMEQGIGDLNLGGRICSETRTGTSGLNLNSTED